MLLYYILCTSSDYTALEKIETILNVKQKKSEFLNSGLISVLLAEGYTVPDTENFTAFS